MVWKGGWRHFKRQLNGRRFITAAAEVGACPLHSHEKYKALYEKLAESSHEESDMEPSDADSDDGQPAGQVRLWKQVSVEGSNPTQEDE